ncbi:unnamed protein product [Caretta caretta]
MAISGEPPCSLAAVPVYRACWILAGRAVPWGRLQPATSRQHSPIPRMLGDPTPPSCFPHKQFDGALLSSFG